MMSVSAGSRFRIRWSFTKCPPPPHPPPHLTAITLQMSLPQIQKYTIYRQHKAAAGRTHTHTKKKSVIIAKDSDSEYFKVFR